MADRKRRRLALWKNRPYERYGDFGQQPFGLILEIGFRLIPLVNGDAPLLDEIKHLRNEIDEEYGLPLPVFHIRYNMCLDPCGYSLLLHGTKITEFKIPRLDYCLCMDTGAVIKELVGEKTKDPAFGMDAIYLPEERREEAMDAGYVVPEWETVIRVHLREVIKKNFTKFLDQCMVNTLINKVRDRNPDVVDDVFFMHNFSTSKFKTILNWLLEEGISIRDMNTILETIADNLEEPKRLSELMEKVREKLVWHFLLEIADNEKKIHVIRVSLHLEQAFSDRIYIPQDNNELPYLALEPEGRNILNEEITKKISSMNEKWYKPVFLTVSNLRTALSGYIKLYFEKCVCISDLDLYSVGKDYNIVVEEELEADEINVNEPCS
jgi:flagellar biosynthesis protein FlhA